MAAPHITAAIAYLKMMQSNLSVDGIYRELKLYCRDLGSKGKDSYYGWGCPIMTNLFQRGISHKRYIVIFRTDVYKRQGEGNGLFIADKNEVWYFEMLLGHNYCAIKMPSNKAAVIPNCLVIGDVDLSDKENVIASPNLVKIAKDNGFYVSAQDGKGDINVKLSYTGKGYSAGNADRIRGGQYLLTGQDNTCLLYTSSYM